MTQDMNDKIMKQNINYIKIIFQFHMITIMIF